MDLAPKLDRLSIQITNIVPIRGELDNRTDQARLSRRGRNARAQRRFARSLFLDIGPGRKYAIESRLINNDSAIAQREDRP
jgi:hypothetical protein